MQQLAAVFEELPPRAIKTGMLYSAEIIQAVAAFLRKHNHGAPLVVDPLTTATSGTRLLQTAAVKPLFRSNRLRGARCTAANAS